MLIDLWAILFNIGNNVTIANYLKSQLNRDVSPLQSVQVTDFSSVRVFGSYTS